MIQKPCRVVQGGKVSIGAGTHAGCEHQPRKRVFFLSGQASHAEDATQIGLSDQNMCRLQAAVRLAAKMGAGLAKCEILFRTVSRRRATRQEG